ncbi:hypothetical protein [Acidiferrimicrobium sp. IK]|nr:hypothetical protein [Acidiferrimicrobium sp. IK]
MAQIAERRHLSEESMTQLATGQTKPAIVPGGAPARHRLSTM